MNLLSVLTKLIGAGKPELATEAVAEPVTKIDSIKGDINKITSGLGVLKGADWDGFQKAWKAHDVKGEIDSGATIVSVFLKVGAKFVPQLAIASSALQVAMVLVPMIDSLAGPLVPDGHGGVVPASNSRFDPLTGRFINTHPKH